LKDECHSKTTAWLKEYFSKASKKLQEFGSSYTKLHTKLDADTLLNIVIHHRKNKTQSGKSAHVKTMCVHSVVSHGRLM
jgi:hypothetical protein